MKKNDTVIANEVIDGVRKRVTRKCVRILEGIMNPDSHIMDYIDISNTNTDINDGKRRYVITYDNISEVPI